MLAPGAPFESEEHKQFKLSLLMGKSSVATLNDTASLTAALGNATNLQSRKASTIKAS